MKNDNEEKIMGIITTNIETMDDVGVMNATKEISGLFRNYYPKEFVKWKDVKSDFIYREFDTNKYLIETGIESSEMKEVTLDELFKLWQNLPENKQ